MQQALRALFKAHCYTDRKLSVIRKYVHGEAQTSLGRFIVDILYKEVCNKYGINRTDEACALVYSIIGVLSKVRATEVQRRAVKIL